MFGLRHDFLFLPSLFLSCLLPYLPSPVLLSPHSCHLVISCLLQILLTAPSFRSSFVPHPPSLHSTTPLLTFKPHPPPPTPTPLPTPSLQLPQNSLKELMESISSSHPHFVCCIKPNSLKKPLMYDTPTVLTQLRYSGIMETIHIRLTFEEFLERSENINNNNNTYILLLCFI